MVFLLLSWNGKFDNYFLMPNTSEGGITLWGYPVPKKTLSLPDTKLKQRIVSNKNLVIQYKWPMIRSFTVKGNFTDRQVDRQIDILLLLLKHVKNEKKYLLQKVTLLRINFSIEIIMSADFFSSIFFTRSLLQKQVYFKYIWFFSLINQS